jgi:hypothetical protein
LLREIIAELFAILVDRNSRQPVIALQINPIEGEPFALPMDIGAAKDVGLSVMAAATRSESRRASPSKARRMRYPVVAGEKH